MDHRVSGRRPSQGRRGVFAPRATGMEVGLSPCTRSVPTSVAVFRAATAHQWFECPCHGSQYNQVGEKKGGPAPRGMDRFAMEVAGSNFSSTPAPCIQGPPIGTNTTGQEAEGPHCIGGAGRPLMRPVVRRSARRITMRGPPSLPEGRIGAQPMMIAVTTTQRPSPCHRRHHHHRLHRLARQRPRRAQGARLGDRAGAEPQGILRRRGARGQAAEPRPVLRRPASSPSSWSVSRCTGSSSRAGWRGPPRMSRTGSCTGVRGSSHLRERHGVVQLRRLPRRLKPTGGSAPYVINDPVNGQFWRGQLDRPGAEQRALPLQRGRGPLHHQLWPSGYAHVGVGPRRRWSADAQQIESRSSTSGRSRSPATDAFRGGGRSAVPDRRTFPPSARRRSKRLHGGPSRTASSTATARSLFNLEMAGGATAAPAATRPAGAGRPGPARPGCLRMEPHRRCREAHFPNTGGHDRLRQRGLGQWRGLRTAGPGSGKMPGFGAMLTEEQIEAIVEYVRGL